MQFQDNSKTNNSQVSPPPNKPADKTFIASNWRSINKSTIVGTADIELPSGLVFRGVMLHERDGKRWIQVPSQQYIKQDGAKGYVPIVEFSSPERWKQFNSACLAAIAELTERGD